MGNTAPAIYQYGIFRDDKPAQLGYSRELICIAYKDKPDYLAPGVIDGCSTVPELFQKVVRKFPNRQFLGTRNLNIEGKPYEWKTYREID